MNEQETRACMETTMKVADEALRDFFHRNNVNYDDFYFSKRMDWIVQLAAGYLAGRKGQGVSLAFAQRNR